MKLYEVRVYPPTGTPTNYVIRGGSPAAALRSVQKVIDEPDICMFSVSLFQQKKEETHAE